MTRPARRGFLATRLAAPGRQSLIRRTLLVVSAQRKPFDRPPTPADRCFLDACDEPAAIEWRQLGPDQDYPVWVWLCVTHAELTRQEA